MQMTWQVVPIALPNVILTIPHTKNIKMFSMSEGE